MDTDYCNHIGKNHIDDEGKTRCSNCDAVIGSALGRYWDYHDPEYMSDEDWELYNEIDFS